MKKEYLNLLISEELVKRAENHGMNLSAFLEIRLQEHLARKIY
jgi:post-segregation antitoxin (ccd killing protein)